MIAEVYLPSERARRYLDHFDAAFSFDLLHADWDRDAIAAAIERSLDLGSPAWVTSNHDFPRVASRWGEENARAAAVLLLTLGGTAFVYQGEEIGMTDGRGGEPPLDRFGRDKCRTPMQWDPVPGAGFTTGTPWLPPADPHLRSVAGQRSDPESILNLFRELITLRREMTGEPVVLDSEPGTLVVRRGAHTVVVDMGAGTTAPAGIGPAEPVLRTDRAAMFRT